MVVNFSEVSCNLFLFVLFLFGGGYFVQFFYLEQLIIKHRAQRDAVNIIAKSDGVDFFFSSRSHAKKLV